ncbi:hypothetical protein HAHI6034_10850 [Hathewaya histolytica]|uniref:Uncharacterized protein n=2 Tax=Hathewaya histolytica TaxID=1498 RepID=A0A4U9RC95_HATHI|nr:hypothetical protein [Hathewaya histolytica]VTQ88796.1 Uncharacterised protein [Hathewaya histolytica]
MENNITMLINENTNLSANVMIKEGNGVSKQVMYLSANLNADTFAVNISVNVMDKEAYKENAMEMKAKYAEFKKQIENRATTLGYVIF